MKFYGDKVANSFEYNWKLRPTLDEHIQLLNFNV